MKPLATRPFRASLLATAVLLLGACGKPAAPEQASPSAPSTAATVTTTATTATTAPAATAATAATTMKPAALLPPAASASSLTPQVAEGIAWQHASNDAEVDAAFAQARRAAKPVFVYWGATWCPPCNQLKATLFNRQDFIARSRAFVPVYVDGDSAGAQKLGARFKVSGYPTMVLFSPQGVELTRLPGEVDAARYQSVLTLAMNANRPVAEVLRQALAGAAGAAALTADDWRLLAFYSWETDAQLPLPKGGLPAVLQTLAAACPADHADPGDGGDTAMRLRLQSLAATGDAGQKAPAAEPARQMLLRLLADEPAARAEMDILANAAADITRALSAARTPHRQQLLAAFDTALQRMEADKLLSRADRLEALAARVDLARIDAPKPDSRQAGAVGRQVTPARLPEALLADVRETAARADREIEGGYERQSVITAAADLLQQAGLGAESDALLKANLGRSHSPYYLMSELAGNARKRGDRVEALHWYQAAFEASVGPATRLQWGSSYLRALVDLAPENDGAIESVAGQLLAEAASAPDAFDGRSGRSMQRAGTSLQAWSRADPRQVGRREAVVRRLQGQLGSVCAALPAGDPSRGNCEALLTPAPAGGKKASA